MQWRKDTRGSILRDNTAEGEKWVAHKKKHIDANIEAIAVLRKKQPKYMKE